MKKADAKHASAFLVSEQIYSKQISIKALPH